LHIIHTSYLETADCSNIQNKVVGGVYGLALFQQSSILINWQK